MTEPHVFIMSTAVDASTDAVVDCLGTRGVRVTRLNTESFPFDTAITAQVVPDARSSVDAVCDGSDLSGMTAAWYRRVRAPERPAEMEAGVYDFCMREARSAMVGMLIPASVRTMSPPANVWAAEHKIHQLVTARELGLEVPHTIVTNDARRIREAFSCFGGEMIAKPVRTGFVDRGDEQLAIYTSRVEAEHMKDLEGAQLSPTILQPLIEKRADVRVTLVGDEIFAAEIDSQSDPAASVDWRRTENPLLPHRRISLPAELAAKAQSLLRRLGLSFGALDFVRTLDDRWVFLEVNPNGQWLWLDDMLGFGISSAIATWLMQVPAR